MSPATVLHDGLMGRDELCRRSGASWRQIDYWVRNGLFVPAAGGTTPGSGGKRRYSATQIPLARALVALMALRDPNTDRVLRRVREIAEHVAEHGPVGEFELIPGVTVDLEELVRGDDG